MQSHFVQNVTSNGSHSHFGVTPEVNQLKKSLMFIEKNEVS